VKSLKLKVKSLGFTMIELLIVIAVLGVLAVAVLATINPIEQINRGRDTSSRGDAEQLLSAIDRYNANTGLWPWQDTANDPADINNGALTKITLTDPHGSSCTMLKNLGRNEADQTCPGTDEIKAQFISRITGSTSNPLWIHYDNVSGHSVYICFNPQSVAFKKQADDKCANPPTDYPVASVCGGNCPTTQGLGTYGQCVCLP